MTFRIDVRLCRYPLHGLDIKHFWPTDDTQVTEGPILVKLLDNGEYLVEDGRHRLIRALLRGQSFIEADWFEQTNPSDEEVAEDLGLETKPPIVLHYTPPTSKAYSYSIDRDGTVRDSQGAELTVAEVRRNLGFTSFHVSAWPHLEPGHCNRTDWHEEHGYILGNMVAPKKCDGLPVASEFVTDRGTQVTNYGPTGPRYGEGSPQAACGKYHRHEPHLMNPSRPMPAVVTEDEICDGIPK